MNDVPPTASPAWDTSRILATYSDVLSTDITLDADFFMSGGHSLTAVMLADRLRQQLGVPVAGLDVMEHVTPRALIAALHERVAVPKQAGPRTHPTADDRRTVLVTGASGGVGSFVVEELLARGDRVRALVRPESIGALQHTAADVVEGDLTRPESLREAVDGVDAVVHAACTFTRPDVDVAAMRVLADGWGGGPFVFVSSVDAYGTPSHPVVREGQATEGAISDYGLGKVRCERVLLEAADRLGARGAVSLVRAPLIWGPHQRLRDQLRWGALGLFYQPVVRGESILLPDPEGTEAGWYGFPWVAAAALARDVASLLDHPARGVVHTIGGHIGMEEYLAELVTLLKSDSRVSTGPAAPQKLRRPWRYSTDVFDARREPGPSEDWRSLLAATLTANDQDRAPGTGQPPAVHTQEAVR
ncbi:NAD(P)H-binding protein [Streptomyces sp. NPDC001822]|uniref:NAD(P)H-binding protein n=1 Tax=Streptomyces sp. NPDC001822 TaxID=3364614 RepID=UPI0036BFFCA9